MLKLSFWDDFVQFCVTSVCQKVLQELLRGTLSSLTAYKNDSPATLHGQGKPETVRDGAHDDPNEQKTSQKYTITYNIW